MIKISEKSAAEHLNLLYNLNGIAKVASGDFVLMYESGWATCSPHEAAKDISAKLDDIDGIRKRIAELGIGGFFLPVPEIVIRDPSGEDYVVSLLSETEYGEPQGWIYLNDDTSLEITHEEYGLDLKDQYFSLRLHCSESDFENDVYHKTMGVIEQCSGGLAEIAPMLQRVIDERGIRDQKKSIILPSKTLAGYEDEFEDTLFHAAYDLLYDCTKGHGMPGYNEFAQACLDSDLHNHVKSAFYDLYTALGFNIESDGTSF